MKRLPVYLIADVSGSMAGEPIELAWHLFDDVIKILQSDPYAVETAVVSIMTFSQKAEFLVKFCRLDSIILPPIPIIQSGPKNCGEALEKLLCSFKSDMIKTTSGIKGDFPPVVIIATKGAPSDISNFNNAVKKIKQLKYNSITVFLENINKKNAFAELTEAIVHLNDYDSADIKSCFQWPNYSILDLENDKNESDEFLPPPPSIVEINIIV